MFVGNSIKSWVNPEAHEFESFIGYNRDVALMSFTKIPEYVSDRNIIKIYDNIYFDNKNGNVVKLLSDKSGGNTNLKAINVAMRDGTSSGAKLLPLSAPITGSTLADMTSTYAFFMPSSNLYETTTSVTEDTISSITTNSATTVISRNLVFYIAWKTDTFLHVIDTTSKDTAYTALSVYIPPNGNPLPRYYDAKPATPGIIGTQYGIQLNDIRSNLLNEPNNNQLVSLQNYDPSKLVYQMCPNVFFDISNGSLIINKSGGGINVYNRPTSTSAGSYVDPTPIAFSDGKIAKDTPTSVTSVSYFPWYIVTPDNNFLVMYIGIGQNTIINVMVLRNEIWSQYNLKRFIGNSSSSSVGMIDNNGELISPKISTNVKNSGSNSIGAPGTGTNPLSDYYRWLAFWNTVANGTNQNTIKSASNMVPKTSVVPSVCSNCPNCNNCNGNVCTNCGGHGGAGTNLANWRESNGRGSNGEPGPGRIIYDTGAGTKELLEEAGSGTTGLVRDAGKAGLGVASAGVGLAKDTVQGGVGLARETVQGGVGLARETVGGTIDLVKSAGTGATNILGSKNPTQVGDPINGSSESGSELVGGNSRQGLGRQGIPGIDPYSYYGALPSKGANYMPITADFSSFSK
jgi:hypothetical protein